MHLIHPQPEAAWINHRHQGITDQLSRSVLGKRLIPRDLERAILQQGGQVVIPTFRDTKQAELGATAKPLPLSLHKS